MSKQKLIEELHELLAIHGVSNIRLDFAIRETVNRHEAESQPTSEDIRDAARYRRLRLFSPRQFAELYQANISGAGTFDELVDIEVAHREGNP